MTKLFATRFLLLLSLLATTLQLTGCGEDDKPQDPQPSAKTYARYSVRYSQVGITTNADGSRAYPKFTVTRCRPDFGRPGYDATCQQTAVFAQEDLSRTLPNDSKTVVIDPVELASVKGQKLYFAVHYYSWYFNRPPAGSSLKAELLGDNEVLSTLDFTAEQASDPQYFNANCNDVTNCGGEAIKVLEFTLPK